MLPEIVPPNHMLKVGEYFRLLDVVLFEWIGQEILSIP